MRLATLPLSALFAFSAVSVSAAQEASERLEIRQPVETWYRVEQGTSPDSREHCGWACERMRPVEGRTWKYEYSYESDSRLVRLSPAGKYARVQVREKMTARLDGSFDVVTLDGELRVGRGVAALHVARTDRGLQAERTAFDGLGEVLEAQRGAPLAFLLALPLLRERQQGGLRRPGRDEVLLVDPAYDFEPLRVRRNIGAEGNLQLEGGRKISAVSVEMRPFRCDDSAKPVVKVLLDRQGLIVEHVGEMGSYVRTQAGSERDARPPAIVAGGEGRRDPFSPQLSRPKEQEEESDPVPDGEPDSVPPPPPVDESGLQRALAELTARFEKIVSLVAIDAAVAGEKFEEAAEEFRKLRGLASGRVALPARSEAALEEALKAVGGIDHSMKVAARLLEQMGRAADGDDEASVLAFMGHLRAVTGRHKPDPRDERTVRLSRMLAEGQEIAGSGAARRELKAMTFALTGASTRAFPMRTPVQFTVTLFSMPIRVDTAVSLWKRDEWVIINDTVYRTGDEISGSGVRVERIHESGCTVNLRGARRDLVLSK